MIYIEGKKNETKILLHPKKNGKKKKKLFVFLKLNEKEKKTRSKSRCTSTRDEKVCKIILIIKKN